MTPVAERTALDAARDVVAALGDGAAAAYLIGSAATGAFEPGVSDLDVVGVLPERPSREWLDRLVERVRAVDVAPARGLELVLYAGDELVLNLNTGPGMQEHVGYQARDEPAFWFVLDRAAAQASAVALVGPPWEEHFEPVERRAVLEALHESIGWHEQNEPASRNAALNAVRAWRYAETGEWLTKRDAAAWLLARARAAVEAAR